MYSETLEILGLSPNEAKIYETLLILGQAAVSDISTKSHIHRRNIYDTLDRLIEKGLVFRIFQKGEHQFHAVTPDKLKEIIEEKDRAISTILPDLKKLYDEKPPREAAFIYKGLEGYKNYRRDLLQSEEEVYFLGAKALWLTPGISRSLHDDFKKSFKKKNILYKTIFDPRVPEELPEAIKTVGGEYKVLPHGYETVGVVDIFGDRVVTFTSEGVGNFGEHGSIFVMINRDLAESYKQWFRFIWEHCPK